jgi:acyl-CoA thioester hydrolase
MTAIRTTIRVRYAETDQMGVVYHANYFVWCEIGRVEFFRQLGHDYKHLEIEDDCHLPVVEANCRYRSPARYDDEIIIETRVTAQRGFVLKFGYRLLRVAPEGEQLLAEEETTHVFVDGKMQKRNPPEKIAALCKP